jgi:hypothetical protein
MAFPNARLFLLVFMWKNCLTILLLAAFGTQTFQQGLLITGFVARQDFIARNLCENRSRPAMHCNGKCQLMKKMRQEEKKDRENPGRKTDGRPTLIAQKMAAWNLAAGPGTTPARFPRINQGKPVDRTLDFFHPPCC